MRVAADNLAIAVAFDRAGAGIALARDIFTHDFVITCSAYYFAAVRGFIAQSNYTKHVESP